MTMSQHSSLPELARTMRQGFLADLYLHVLAAVRSEEPSLDTEQVTTAKEAASFLEQVQHGHQIVSSPEEPLACGIDEAVEKTDAYREAQNLIVRLQGISEDWRGKTDEQMFAWLSDGANAIAHNQSPEPEVVEMLSEFFDALAETTFWQASALVRGEPSGETTSWTARPSRG